MSRNFNMAQGSCVVAIVSSVTFCKVGIKNRYAFILLDSRFARWIVNLATGVTSQSHLHTYMVASLVSVA